MFHNRSMAKVRFPDQPDLFSDDAPEAAPRGLYAIAPHAPFLETLADRVLDGTLLAGWPREGPFWLTDVTIIVPTRRARLALAEAFAARGHGLLPDIRTFGGEPQEEEPFLPPHDLPALPSAVPPGERRLVLARLIEAWAKSDEGKDVLASPPNAAEIVGLADSLGELIDDLEIAGVTAAKVRALPVEEAAGNWQNILRFLGVALDMWPAHLRERGAADAAALRNEHLLRQTTAAAAIFGERPVIAAGSTGSIPATAALMRAIVRLPRGALVLPGLDTTLLPDQHAALIDAGRNPHGHPQYGLAQLLRYLGAGPGEVVELASEHSARTAVVRAALGLAEATGQWPEARGRLAPRIGAAAEAMTLLAARNADEEARAVALCARDALAGGRTVGIVTPDQTLARRIAVELRRFGVMVDDPAGTPLFLSPAGRLARLLAALVESEWAPVELIAVLRHRSAGFGVDRREVARLADRLEQCVLRGAHPRPGLAGLREAVARNGAEGSRGPRLTANEKAAIDSLFGLMEAALAPLAALPTTAAALAAALRSALSAATGDAAPHGTEELAGWAGVLEAHPGQGPTLPARGLDSVLAALMAGHAVRPAERRRDDIAIWGLLEARLQSRDLTILCGLNEDIWPQPAEPGPWLSRKMRLELGLEPPERRQGQAAHDFEMAIGNRDVVLAWAARLGTSPALPSRLVQRLTAFLGAAITDEMMRRGEAWIAGARSLDAVPDLRPAARPMPRPPADARPRELRVTEVETLFRSPYDLYARHVLRLTPLAPLGQLPSARERGTIVHDIFADFVRGHDVMAPDALDRLEALATERFATLDSISARRDIWRHRFGVAALQFLKFERARQHRVARRHAEIAGKWVLPKGFTLSGRADRIDIMADGGAELLDFKTGSIPLPAVMRELLAPQLPLEAAMLAAGAFEGVGQVDASALTYIKIGLGPEAFVVHPFRHGEGMEVGETADAGVAQLTRYVDAFLLSDTLPMTSQLLPDTKRRYPGDYDHLARVDEWTINEGDLSE